MVHLFFQIVKYELPVLIPAAIGILGGLLVLIVTPCYLCCHYCGCCGTKLQLVRIQQQKRWCMYVTGLFVLCCICFIWWVHVGLNHNKINLFPNDKRKLEAFADNKFNVANMMIYLYDRVENTLGKGQNAGSGFSLNILFRGSQWPSS